MIGRLTFKKQIAAAALCNLRSLHMGKRGSMQQITNSQTVL